MADLIIYRNGNTIDVRDGAPPADQSAVVAQLTADLDAMTADRDEWRRRYEDATAPSVEPPRITGFAADPDSITAGQSTTLTATLHNVASATLNGEGITVPADGQISVVVTPPTSRSYVLDVVGLDGSTLTSVAVLVTVAPVVEEPPPPPADGAENPLLIYDSTPGLTRDSLYLRIIQWANKGGDWTDRDGKAQGSAPYASTSVAKGRTDPLRLDATALAAAGEPVQICIRATAIMSFRSRAYGAQGPALELTYADGSNGVLYAVADAESNVSTAYELGGNAALGLSYSNRAYVRFPAPAKPVANATLVLVPSYINESGRVDLYRFAIHLDKLGVVEPYAPMTDCFVETEAFERGTVPDATYNRIARINSVTQPDAAWKQWEWVTRPDGGKALRITFDPRGSSALSSAIPFPGGIEADEVEWEFKIRMNEDLLIGARDGFKLFAGPTSKTKPDDNAFVHFSGSPEYLGTFGTLLAGNGGSKAHGDDGWSLRWDAWNSPPAGHPMHGRFLPMQYAYHPEQSDYYGDAWSWSGQNTAMVVGQAHTVRQRCRINSVTHLGMGQMDARKDAEFDGWLDGLPVLRKRDFRMRTTLWPLIGKAPHNVPRTNLAIGRIWLNSYHGGTSTPKARCSFDVWDFRARIITPTEYVPPLVGG